MKTLYVLAHTPTRLTISGRKESEINRAVRAAATVAKKPGWDCSIELALSNRPLTIAMQRVRVKVNARNADGNVTSSIDLGYESYEGWESALGLGRTGEYSELPDVWFSDDFMDMAFEPRKKGTPRLPILKGHEGALLNQFASHIENWLDDDELLQPTANLEQSIKREIAFRKGVLSLISDVKEGRLPETILQEVWPGRHGIFDTPEQALLRRSRGVERE